MAQVVPNIFSQDVINYIINLPDVISAKRQIDKQSEGKVNFTVPLTPSIRSSLYEDMGLDLTGIDVIPMRWIKGDTESHIDRGINHFSKTHLVYLTDNTGEFIIDNKSYPIIKGSGYIFSEGLKHETVGTGSEPRLLLGPMSEKGAAVGGPTTIEANGQTDIIYIRYDVGSGTTYKINNGSYTSFSLPLTIKNTNIFFRLQVLFETDLILNSPQWFIICGSANIQFGSTSLNNDGTRRIITIDNVSNYPGFIRNGESSSNGNNNIYIFNLDVIAINGSTVITDGGWIGQSYFGKGASNNFIINCSSSGPIIDGGGGIVGGYAGSDNGALLHITGCSSDGNTGDYSGGIIGFFAGSNGGEVICESCWSIGSIGRLAGGIIGFKGGDGGGNAHAIKCYSTGPIDLSGGGIFGDTAGRAGTARAEKCYSQGSIGTSAGGIFGSNAGSDIGATPAINCYSSEAFTPGNGIYGSDAVDDSPFNCYSANGNWSNTTANTRLNGVPNPVVGITWVASAGNYPYELNEMGYTPYIIENIVFEGIGNTPILKQSYNQTISAGQSSIPAIRPGYSYDILKISGGNQSSYATITINDNTGVISTTTATVPGTYIITLRNTGSYNITTFNLIVASSTPPDTNISLSIPPCCQPICPQFNQTTNNTQEQLAIKQTATAIASNVDSTYLAINQNKSVQFIQPAFKSYRDYMIYLQSKYR